MKGWLRGNACGGGMRTWGEDPFVWGWDADLGRGSLRGTLRSGSYGSWSSPDQTRPRPQHHNTCELRHQPHLARGIDAISSYRVAEAANCSCGVCRHA